MMQSVFGLSAYLITVIAIVAITIRSLELYRRIKVIRHHPEESHSNDDNDIFQSEIGFSA